MELETSIEEHNDKYLSWISLIFHRLKFMYQLNIIKSSSSALWLSYFSEDFVLQVNIYFKSTAIYCS
jgi:hypothetical protein